MGFIRTIFIFLWTGILVPLSLVISKLTSDHRIPLRMARSPWGKGVLFLSGLKLQVQGLDRLDVNQPHIYVSNHSSYMDIPCLFAGLPIDLYFIAKSQVKKIPFVGFFMKATQMIFIDQTTRQKAIESMNEAGELIRKGKSVLVFPEGTRSAGNEIRSFKKGVFALAKNAGIPVVPLALRGTHDRMPSGSLSIKPGQVQLSIGDPILAEDFDNLQDFMSSARTKMMELVK